jgi:endonuclease/exonuclease/phosphatase family metal-dependent hydrolase
MKRRPIVLAGDFNAVPESAEIKDLGKEFSTARRLAPHSQGLWTHVKHKILIDYVFFSDPDGVLVPTEYWIVEPGLVGEVTDHLPLVAKVRLA